MALSDIFDRIILTRRLVTGIERVAKAQEQTNVLLSRLADHLAPVVPLPTDEEVKTAGPSFVSDRMHAEVEEFRDRFLERHGREATEEDVLEYLEETERGVTH